MAIMPGYHYEITGLKHFPGEGDADDGTALEFSDQVNNEQFGEEDEITLTFYKTDGSSKTCVVSSSHDRDWLGWEGAFKVGSGIGACTDGPTRPPTTVAPTPAPVPTPAPPPTPRPVVPSPVPSPIGQPGECTEDPC